MNFFDNVNEGLFSLFIGENKNLYFEIIDLLYKNCDSYRREISRTNAKTLISEMLKQKAQNNTGTKYEELASNYILTLKEHGWIVEDAPAYSDNILKFTHNGDILYKAMLKMSIPNSEFEFRTAIQSVYMICERYTQNGYVKENFYIDVLNPIYKTTMELRHYLTNFHNEFDELIKDLSKDMDAKELLEYVNGILKGTQLQNYSRLLNNELEYQKYKQNIVYVLNDILHDDEDLFVKSYIHSVHDKVENPENYIDKMISDVIYFYQNEYSSLVYDMKEIMTSYLFRIGNKLKLSFGEGYSLSGLSDMLMAIFNADKSESDYSDEKIINLMNLWKVGFINESSLTHNTERELSIAPKQNIETEELTISDDELLKKFNTENKNNPENIRRYLREKIGTKKKIHATDFNIQSVDEYSKLNEVIRNCFHDDFDYEINITDEDLIKIGNCVCTPFVIKKRGKNEV